MKRVSDERGAAIVEFAIILPILLLVLAGIVEWSLVFKDGLTLASTSRAGARVASANGRSDTFAADTVAAVTSALDALPDDSVTDLWIYKAGTNGYPEGRSSFSAGCDRCYRYTWNSSTDEFRLESGTGWAKTDRNACAGEADTVGVYVRATHRFISGAFPASTTLTDKTVMRLEPVASFEGCRG